MELSKRKQQVLSAIIKAYIETGEPIGSKNLATLIKDAPSSATLRNEMNALCALGLLSQPHTSAGRIPTSMGYRVYVNSLMGPSSIIESTKNYINSSLSNVGCDTKNIPKNVATALSTLTGYPAIYCYIVDKGVYLKNAKLLPLSRKSAVLLTIFSDGRTVNSICHIPLGIDEQMIEQFDSIVSSQILKRPLGEYNKALLQSIIASAGINALPLTPLFTTLFDAIEETAESKAEIVGSSSLHNFCNEREARMILSLAERTTPILNVFNKSSCDTDVIFGNDTGFDELKNKVMVVSTYNCNNKYCGKIGIIGPDRLSYEQIIPSIQYIANKLTALLSMAVNDMED